MKFSKYFFFAKRLLTDISENTNLPLSEDISSSNLKYYYLKFEEEEINSRGGNKAFLLDNNGVPQIHSYIDVVDGAGYYYYPITIGQYALTIFHSYLNTKNEEKKAHFLKIANWFYDNRIEDKELGVYWLSSVPKPEYRITKPWKSGFSQSRGLSILLRAWQISNDNKYLEVAKKALIPFSINTSNGGVAVDTETDIYYEEYVAAKPTRVLDGHIFCLFGLYDAVRAITPEIDKESHELALKLYNKGIESLIKKLPEYDLGYWMRFNLSDFDFYPKNDPCTIGYLRLINAQLRILDNINPNDVLKDFIKKTKKYDRLPNIIRMYKLKFSALKQMNRL